MVASSDPSQSPPRRVVNLKAVVICGIVLVVVSLGMKRLHSRQIVETTSHLKQTADAVLHGPSHEAIEALERYLAFSNDPAARDTLSGLLVEHASDRDTLQTAYAMNQGLLLNELDNTELRLRQARLAVRLGLFSDADSLLTSLRTSLPDNGEVWYLSGVAAQHAERPEQAVTCYQRAVEKDCDDADCYARLADLTDSRPDGRAASERRFEQLIARHPSPEAYRVHAEWLLNADRSNHAAAALWSGLQLAPDDLRLNSLLVTTLQTAAVTEESGHAQEQQKLIHHLQQQVARHPADTHLRLLCVHVQWTAGQQDTAISTLKEGITRHPQAFELQEVLIDYLVSRDDSEQARAAFRRLPRTALSHARWHFLEGRVRMAEEDWSQAAASFEKASGFAEADARIRHRSGMCLAVCRRELGERDHALETYRSMIHARPDSQDSRLGIAATWLEADRIDLAIAEYRQLQDIPGVPELLASLLIRETLRQPPSLRDWNEVATLLSSEDPVIKDSTQRMLLTADLLFAQGHPAQALHRLDHALTKYPQNDALRASRRRVLTDRNDVLRKKMDSTLTHQPDSLEAHVTVLRLLAHQDGYQAAVAAIANLTAGRRYQQLPEEQRCRIAAVAAELLAADLQQFESRAAATAMLDQAESAWARLAAVSPDSVPQQLAFLARHRPHESVLKALAGLSHTLDADIVARSCLMALTNTAEKNELRAAVEQSLRQSIVNDPADLRLRQAYAEYLLQFAEYDQALTIERQILHYEPRNAMAMSHGAWILIMTQGDHEEALALSESASRYAPHNSEVRTVRGLVLAHSDAPADALPVFRSVPEEARSPESFVYEALALLRSGRPKEAARTAQAVQQYHSDRWRPADRRLLQHVVQQVTIAEVTER